MPTPEEVAAAVDVAALTPIVRRALDSEAAELTEWRHERLPYVNAIGRRYRGLFSFSGRARDGSGTHAWSLVPKVIGKYPNAADDPKHPAFWRREVLAYGSGLLAALPGIAAPRCLQLDESEDETAALWLESLEDEHDGRWPLERYGVAARHLGRFNGAYVTDRLLPDHEWLVPGRGGGGDAQRIEEMLRRSETWQHPEVRRAFPAPIVDRALRQLEDRRAFRAAIAGEPLTLCHLDAGSQNLFARRNAAGEEETVAIDWELMGTSPLTTDITYLVMQTLRRFDVDTEEADRLEELVLGGYIEGLRDAGWSGEDVAIRRAYTAGIALRTGIIPQVLSFILDEAQRAKIEPIWNRPPEQLIERWAWLAYFVLDRADRTRAMLEEA